MCVSAEASFGLTGVLAPVGLYCVTIALRRDRASLPLAAVPLLFGIQQACEGLVWVGIGHENPELTHSAALAYLFFALTFWLFWIPFSTAILEPRRKFKVWLGIGAALGLGGGLAFYLPILSHPEILLVTVVNGSLRYDFALAPALAMVSQLVWHLAYLAVVAVPPMIVAKQRKGLVIYAVTLVISSAISHAYFWYAFSSVWCFFAAFLSLILGYVFHELPFPGNAISGALTVGRATRPSGSR